MASEPTVGGFEGEADRKSSSSPTHFLAPQKPKGLSSHYQTLCTHGKTTLSTQEPDKENTGDLYFGVTFHFIRDDEDISFSTAA